MLQSQIAQKLIAQIKRQAFLVENTAPVLFSFGRGRGDGGVATTATLCDRISER